jgi:hypothetical protein
MLEGEVWKYIEIGKGVQYISNKGRCWNDITCKFAKSHDNGAGYKSYSISGNGSKYIHRLVATAFIDNPENKKYVNHIDHNKENNCVENLEWVTAKENTQHGIRAGRINSKSRGKTNVLTLQDRANAVILRKLGRGINEIAKILGFPRTTMSSVFNGRSGGELVELIQSEIEGWSEQRLNLALTNNLK